MTDFERNAINTVDALQAENTSLRLRAESLAEELGVAKDALSDAEEVLSFYGADGEWDSNCFLGDTGGDDPQFVGNADAKQCHQRILGVLARLTGREEK